MQMPLRLFRIGHIGLILPFGRGSSKGRGNYLPAGFDSWDEYYKAVRACFPDEIREHALLLTTMGSPTIDLLLRVAREMEYDVIEGEIPPYKVEKGQNYPSGGWEVDQFKHLKARRK